MSHYILELVLWMLLAFFVGCIFGCLFRKYFGADSSIDSPRATESFSQVAPEPVQARIADPLPYTPPEPAPATVVIPKPDEPSEPVPVMGRSERPKGIAKAREGKPDKLQRISGVGPKNERVLHNLGFFHFDQIAAWSKEQISWVDDHLKFNGRIDREQWVKQAKLLADGEEVEFMRLYGSGGMRDRSGERKSGDRTRKT